MTPLLEVRDLRVRITLPAATVTPVDGFVSHHIQGWGFGSSIMAGVGR